MIRIKDFNYNEHVLLKQDQLSAKFISMSFRLLKNICLLLNASEKYPNFCQPSLRESSMALYFLILAKGNGLANPITSPTASSYTLSLSSSINPLSIPFLHPILIPSSCSSWTFTCFIQASTFSITIIRSSQSSSPTLASNSDRLVVSSFRLMAPRVSSFLAIVYVDSMWAMTERLSLDATPTSQLSMHFSRCRQRDSRGAIRRTRPARRADREVGKGTGRPLGRGGSWVGVKWGSEGCRCRSSSRQLLTDGSRGQWASLEAYQVRRVRVVAIQGRLSLLPFIIFPKQKLYKKQITDCYTRDQDRGRPDKCFTFLILLNQRMISKLNLKLLSIEQKLYTQHCSLTGPRPLAILNLLGQPLKPLHNALPIQRTSRLHIPTPPQALNIERLDNLLRGGIGHIHLIRQDEERGTGQPIIGEDLLQGLPGELEPLGVAAIDHVDDGVGVVEVEAPEVADFGLASDVPDIELQVLEFDLLDVEPDGRD